MAKNKKDEKKLKELNLELKDVRHRFAHVLIKLKQYENQLEQERGMKL